MHDTGKYLILFLLLIATTSYCNEQEPSKEVTSTFSILSNNFSHVSTPYTIVLWLLIAAVAKIMFHVSNKFSETFPDSALLIIVGLALGYALKQSHVDDSKFTLSAHTFFVILLPPIIFDAGYFMPNRLLFENADSVLLFAVVGTIFNTLTIGGGLYGLGYLGYFSVPFSIFEILCFAALISAVDPVAVIAVFEEIHVNEFLFINVFGEALFNDGVTVVLYQMFKEFHIIKAENLKPIDYFKGGMSFFVIALGGILIGVIFAFLVSLFTKYSQKVIVISPVFIFLMPYLAYLTAESFGLSSILAITSCGMIMKQYVKGNISHSAASSVKYFIKMLAHSSETAIFMFLGLSTISLAGYHWDTSFVICTIVFCVLFRVIGVTAQCYVLNKFRKEKFSMVDQFVMSYGGLRGCIAYGLAISMPDSIKAKNMFVTACIAEIYFSVFIQGITIRPLLNFLKVKKSENRSLTMLESVYSRYFDYTLTGIEDIAGLRGKNSFRTWFENLNARVLRPLFIRKATKGKFDASHILRAYKKIAIEEALREREFKEEKRKSMVFSNHVAPSSLSKAFSINSKIAPHLLMDAIVNSRNHSGINLRNPSMRQPSYNLDSKSRVQSINNVANKNQQDLILEEIMKFINNKKDAEKLSLNLTKIINNEIDVIAAINSDDSDSDIEEDYMMSMRKREFEHLKSQEKITNLAEAVEAETVSMNHDFEQGRRRSQFMTKNHLAPDLRPRSMSLHELNVVETNQLQT
uniref:Sodium/hydrogen exchanger n=1 Tax=Rhabditophanes sp. KR3021 TaxID=114890 RepID=A0AC35TI22_9BILA